MFINGYFCLFEVGEDFFLSQMTDTSGIKDTDKKTPI